jgi:hypothetical protein
MLAVRVSGVSRVRFTKSVTREYPKYKIKEKKRPYGTRNEMGGWTGLKLA